VEDDNGVLKPLYGAIEQYLGKIGYPREEREFKPHLTLGRVRSPKGKPELLKRMEGFLHVELGEFRVERLVLFKSDLRPTGPIYTELRALILGGG
jgi:2'-5' RNA ligase